MGTEPDVPTWAQSDRPRRTRVNGVVSYVLFTDEQLIGERDRLMDQLNELTLHSGSSTAVGRLLVSIDREFEHITAELIKRARTRHPSAGSPGSRLRFRSRAWPPQAR